MRFLKLAIISVIVIFIILTAMSSLLPSKVLVSRAIDIQAPVPIIKEQVFRLNNWQQWMLDARGEKAKIDSIEEQGISIGGTEIHVSSSDDSTCHTTWVGNSIMEGTFTIINHQRVDSVITVQWQMEQKVRWYPWEKFASITKDEIWGGSMEKSLENLKLLVESH